MIPDSSFLWFLVREVQHHLNKFQSIVVTLFSKKRHHWMMQVMRCILRLIHMSCRNVQKNIKLPISVKTQPSAAAVCIKHSLCESAFKESECVI